MLTQISFLVGGILLLVVGAEGLVRGSSSLARRLGLTPLVVGLTVVVSVEAVLRGAGDIAAGNAVGSNIANIGLILAVTAIICPIPVGLSLLKLDAPVMILATLVVGGFLLSGTLSAGVGALLVGSLFLYIGWNVRMARHASQEAAAQAFADEIPEPSGSVLRDLIFVVLGLVGLVVGARLLVSGASELARAAGVSEATIGLTVVAVGTSLPELAASIVAAVRRQTDIAVGNIIGSNIFNLLGILGTAALIGPLEAPGIRLLDIAAMAVLAFAVIPMIWTGRRVIRTEGVVLLALYASYLWLVLA